MPHGDSKYENIPPYVYSRKMLQLFSVTLCKACSKAPGKIGELYQYEK